MNKFENNFFDNLCVYNYCSVHPVFPRIMPSSLHVMFFKICKIKTDIYFCKQFHTGFSYFNKWFVWQLKADMFLPILKLS